MSKIFEYLTEAVALGASDLHLKPGQIPFFRISGELEQSHFPPLTDADIQEIVREILPAHLVKSYQESHEADFSLHRDDLGRFRVNLFQAQMIPSLVFRHVKQQVPSLDELHLPRNLLKICGVQRGLVFISGVTGSGKSTTLASLIQHINCSEHRRIITIEDPIEYMFRDELSVITQREIGLDTLTFHSALRTILRQDPDIIVIGEMRDELSFKTAVAAAETGHLVFTTMHAGTASTAVQRILQFFPNSEWEQARLALASNLHSVVCQRLMRNTRGDVVPAVEILFNTPTVRKLIEKDKLDLLSVAIETGSEDGMQTFNQSIYGLIKSGMVSEEEGMAYATNPAALRMNLQGIFLDEGKRILNI